MSSLDHPMLFLATKNPEASRAFYEGTLDLAFRRDEPFALVFDVNGLMLRIQKVERLEPAGHTVLGWSVEDIARAVAELSERGVRFERFEGMPQDEQGIWTAPGGAMIAWFRDPDGNTLSLTQHPIPQG